MVFGEMNFVIWCCMLSHFLKKVFLQCRCYQGWFQYPSSWKPQAQLEKNWDPAFTFWSPVKNEHFRSMFVTCAFPGLKPIEFGKCFPSKMHWGHIHFHRDQGMTLALMGKKIWNSLIFLKHINEVNLKKKENHKTLIIQHNLTKPLGARGNRTTNSSGMFVQNAKNQRWKPERKKTFGAWASWADWCRLQFWMFWKILKAEHVEHVDFKRFERWGGLKDRKKMF